MKDRKSFDLDSQSKGDMTYDEFLKEKKSDNSFLNEVSNIFY